VGDRVVIAGQAGLKEGALVKLPGEEGAATIEPIETDDAEEVVARAAL